MAFCHICGYALPDGAKFCSSCGAVVGKVVNERFSVSAEDLV